MTNFELRLKALYNRKIEIQNLEHVNDKDKKLWAKLGEKVRSQSQKIYELKEELIKTI